MSSNEHVPLKGWILEYTCLMFDRAPPFRGELTDLGSSFRNARYESALTVDDSGKPARRNITCIEEVKEVLVSKC